MSEENKKENTSDNINIKVFSVTCDFGGAKHSVPFSLGYPEPSHNPISFQASFISKTRGGVVPENIISALTRLYNLATENNLDFPEFAEYAIKNSEGKESIN